MAPSVITTLALVALAFTGAARATRICGNYCGPGWCSGKDIDESKCDDSGAPEFSDITGEASCADTCCKAHDSCCGHGDRSTCNKAIVACLDGCNDLSLTCTRDDIGVPAGAIKAGMSLVPDWCCGSPCPGADSGADSGSNGGGSLWDKIGDALGLAADDGEKKTNARSNTAAIVVGSVAGVALVVLVVAVVVVRRGNRAKAAARTALAPEAAAKLNEPLLEEAAADAIQE